MVNCRKVAMENAERERGAEHDPLSIILTSDAYLRLSNVRLVNPGLYEKVRQFLILSYSQGRIMGKIDDNRLRDILTRFLNHRETKIRRI